MTIHISRRRRRRLCGSSAILVVVFVTVVCISLLLVIQTFSTNTTTTTAKQHLLDFRTAVHTLLPPPGCPHNNRECPALLDKTMMAQLRNVTTRILLAGEGRGEGRGDRWTGESHHTGLTFPSPHNINIRFIVLEQNFCKVPDLQVIVYVHSAPANRKSRDAIRATWGHPEWFPVLRHKVVFVLGDPQHNSTRSELLDESWLYHDVLLVDFHDTYHNLSYKGVSALWWVARHCQGPTYVLKTDDDMFVNIFALARLINAHGGDLSASIERKGKRRMRRKIRRKKNMEGGGKGGGGEEANGKNKDSEKEESDNTVDKQERWKADNRKIIEDKRESAGDRTKQGTGGEEKGTIKSKGGLERGSGGDNEDKAPESVKSSNDTAAISVEKRSQNNNSKENGVVNQKADKNVDRGDGVNSDDTKSNHQHHHNNNNNNNNRNNSNASSKNNNNEIDNNGTVMKSLKEEVPKIHCLVWEGMRIMRAKDNKWYVDPEDYEGEKYPPYCSGSAFILSWDAAPALLKASSSSRFLWVDDVYLTGVLVNNSNVELVRRNSLYELSTAKFLTSMIEGNRVFYHHTRTDVKTSESLWEMLVQKENEVPVTVAARKK